MQGRYTLAFLGFGNDEDSVQIELTYNWDPQDYTKGDGYAQIAVSTTVRPLLPSPQFSVKRPVVPPPSPCACAGVPALPPAVSCCSEKR